MNIQIVEARRYNVRMKTKNGRHVYKSYRTLKTASKAIAWRMVFDKYEGLSLDKSSALGQLVYADRPKWLVCECGEFDRFDYDESPVYHWGDCPIHDRRTGYYARVQKRLARFILAILEEAFR
jgi:hypothetical protein